MKVIRLQFGFWHWLQCVFFHRRFYIQDKKGNWICDACRQNALEYLNSIKKKDSQ